MKKTLSVLIIKGATAWSMATNTKFAKKVLACEDNLCRLCLQSGVKSLVTLYNDHCGNTGTLNLGTSTCFKESFIFEEHVSPL
jgi:hypothetical protein